MVALIAPMSLIASIILLKVSYSDFVYVTEKAHLAHKNIGLIVVVCIEDQIRFCIRHVQDYSEKLI